MAETTMEERVDAVERLTKLYKPERTVHLVATTSSVIILLVAAVMMIYSGKASTSELGLMFGSTGIAGFTAGQLLKMFDRAMTVIAGGVK